MLLETHADHKNADPGKVLRFIEGKTEGMASTLSGGQMSRTSKGAMWLEQRLEGKGSKR